MATKTYVLGFLLILVVSASLVSVMMNDLKIDVTKTKSVFYVQEGGAWVVSGEEWNYLYNGTKALAYNSTATKITNIINNKSNIATIVRTTNYKNSSAQVIDTYTFDGNLEDKELFPIEHKIEIKNAKGLEYRYLAKKLVYNGKTLTLNQTGMAFGRNMFVEWQDGYKSAQISNSTKTLTIKYDVGSDDETYYIRLFDPIINDTGYQSLMYENQRKIVQTKNGTKYLLVGVVNGSQNYMAAYVFDKNGTYITNYNLTPRWTGSDYFFKFPSGIIDNNDILHVVFEDLYMESTYEDIEYLQWNTTSNTLIGNITLVSGNATNNESYQPDIAILNNGTIGVAYAQENSTSYRLIRFKECSGVNCLNGNNWTAPVVVAAGGAALASDQRLPDLETDGNNFTMAFTGHNSSASSYYVAYFAQRINTTAWTLPEPINLDTIIEVSSINLIYYNGTIPSIAARVQDISTGFYNMSFSKRTGGVWSPWTTVYTTGHINVPQNYMSLTTDGTNNNMFLSFSGNTEYYAYSEENFSDTNGVGYDLTSTYSQWRGWYGGTSYANLFQTINQSMINISDRTASYAGSASKMLKRIRPTQIDFRIRTNDTTKICYYYLNDDSANVMNQVYFQTGMLRHTGGSVTIIFNNTANNTWYNVSLRNYNYTDFTVDIYVDDVLRQRGTMFGSSVTPVYITKVSIVSNVAQTGYECLFDDLKIYNATTYLSTLTSDFDTLLATNSTDGGATWSTPEYVSGNNILKYGGSEYPSMSYQFGKTTVWDMARVYLDRWDVIALDPYVYQLNFSVLYNNSPIHLNTPANEYSVKTGSPINFSVNVYSPYNNSQNMTMYLIFNNTINQTKNITSPWTNPVSFNNVTIYQNTSNYTLSYTVNITGNDNENKTVNTYCFQETANVSADCSGLTTSTLGNYSYSGDWDAVYVVSKGYDGNWSSYTACEAGEGVGKTAYLYINYTKPTYAQQNNSYWQYKYNWTAKTFNFSIPTVCWNQNLLRFKIKSEYYRSTLQYQTAQCYNGTDWGETLLNSNYSTDGFGALYFWEEAMIWGYMSYTSDQPRTINVKSLSPPTFSDKTETNASYAPGKTYTFTMKIVDDYAMSNVWFKFNGTTYSVTNLSNNVYSATIPANTYPVATYQYIWYANDTDNNIANSTNSYGIVKAITGISLTLNGVDNNMVQDTNSIVNMVGTCTSCETSYIELRENGVQLINASASTVSYAKNYTSEGVRNISAYYPATQNFSAGWANHTLSIFNHTSTLLDGLPQNRTYEFATIANVTSQISTVNSPSLDPATIVGFDIYILDYGLRYLQHVINSSNTEVMIPLENYTAIKIFTGGYNNTYTEFIEYLTDDVLLTLPTYLEPLGAYLSLAGSHRRNPVVTLDGWDSDDTSGTYIMNSGNTTNFSLTMHNNETLFMASLDLESSDNVTSVMIMDCGGNQTETLPVTMVFNSTRIENCTSYNGSTKKYNFRLNASENGTITISSVEFEFVDEGDYPTNVKLDTGNDRVIDVSIDGQMIGSTITTDKFSNNTTSTLLANPTHVTYNTTLYITKMKTASYNDLEMQMQISDYADSYTENFDTIDNISSNSLDWNSYWKQVGNNKTGSTFISGILISNNITSTGGSITRVRATALEYESVYAPIHYYLRTNSNNWTEVALNGWYDLTSGTNASFKIYIESDGTHSSYVDWFKINGFGSYPQDLLIDVGSDGSYEVNETGRLTTTLRTLDLGATSLNNYVCASETCEVPVYVQWLGIGNVTLSSPEYSYNLSNLNINEVPMVYATQDSVINKTSVTTVNGSSDMKISDFYNATVYVNISREVVVKNATINITGLTRWT